MHSHSGGARRNGLAKLIIPKALPEPPPTRQPIRRSTCQLRPLHRRSSQGQRLSPATWLGELGATSLTGHQSPGSCSHRAPLSSQTSLFVAKRAGPGSGPGAVVTGALTQVARAVPHTWRGPRPSHGVDLCHPHLSSSEGSPSGPTLGSPPSSRRDRPGTERANRHPPAQDLKGASPEGKALWVWPSATPAPNTSRASVP